MPKDPSQATQQYADTAGPRIDHLTELVERRQPAA